MPCVITAMVPMRDGVKLFTKVCLPEIGRKYNEDGALAGVEQDVRGSGSSEGVMHPWIQKLNDGEDCIKWISEQSWFGGHIAMIGPSYLGAAQWFAAASGRPELVSLAPSVAPCNYFDSPKYFGGEFVLQQNVIRGLERRKANDPGRYAKAELSAELSSHLPLNDIDRKAGLGNVDYWQEWLNYSSYDDYWKRYDFRTYVEK